MAPGPEWRPAFDPAAVATRFEDGLDGLPEADRIALADEFVALARAVGPVPATAVAIAAYVLGDDGGDGRGTDAEWAAGLADGLVESFPAADRFRAAARDASDGDAGPLVDVVGSYHRDADRRREVAALLDGGAVDRDADDLPERLRERFDAPTTRVAVAAAVDLRRLLTSPEVHRRGLAVHRARATDPVDGDGLSEWLDGQLGTVRASFRDVESQIAGQLGAGLDREGFRRLTPVYFDREPSQEPETYWRAGFTLRAVHEGYAYPRESVAGDLLDSLRNGEDRLVVGRAGSGKSTLCKTVACRWYDRGVGTVLYRDGSANARFEDGDALRDAVDAGDGHVLVVVEDAVRPENNRVFEVIDSLDADADVSFLLDVRRARLRSLEGTLGGEDSDVVRRIRRLRGSRVRDFDVPGIDRETCAGIVAHYERVTGNDVIQSPESLYRRVQPEQGVGGDEMIHLAYNLIRPATGYASGLEKTVEEAYDRLRDPDGVLARHGDLARGVVLAVNLLNAANVPVHRELLHALGDDHAAIDGIIDALGGEFLFRRGDAGVFETNHEFWSALYVRLLVLREEPSVAHERFAECVNAIFSITDPEVREEIEAWTDGSDGAPADPDPDDDSERLVTVDQGSYLSAVLPAAKLVEKVADLGTRWPVLAPLYGTCEESEIRLPERCSTMTRVRFVSRRGDMYLSAGDVERAAAEYRHARGLVDDSDDVDRQLRRKHRARYHNSLGDVAIEQGDLDDAESHYERALEVSRGIRYRTGEARSLDSLGIVARKRGDLDAAEDRYERALSIYRELGSRNEGGRVLKNLGTVSWQKGEYDRAEEYFTRSLRIYRDIGSRHGESNCLNNLGVTAEGRGDVDAAEQYYRQSLELDREIGDRPGEAKALNNLGLLARKRGDLDDAEEYHTRSLEIKREIGNPESEAAALGNLGLVAREKENLDEAEAYHRESLDIYRDIGHPDGEARSRNNLGGVAQAKGDLDAAERHYERSLAVFRDVGNRYGRAESLRSLGSVARQRGDLADAIDRLERATELFVEMGSAEAVPSLRKTIEVAADAGDDDRAADWCDRAEAFTEETEVEASAEAELCELCQQVG